MFQGRLKTTLLDSGALRDADFLRAIKGRRISPLLDSLKPRMQLEQRNQIFDNFVPYMFYRSGWSGCGAPPDPFQESTGNGDVYFGFIVLTSTDTEPTYTEYNGSVGYYDQIHTMSGSVDTSAGAKWFVTNQIEDWQIWSATDGQERIFFRGRWLYLPSQAVSANIKSLDVYFIRNRDSYNGHDKSRSARIRFKDSGGNPVTINKTGSQVLLLEYNWSLLSV